MSVRQRPLRSFEEALSELEDRVRQLEGAELPLEGALELFEEGIELARECHEQLDTEALAARLEPSGPSTEGDRGPNSIR